MAKPLQRKESSDDSLSSFSGEDEEVKDQFNDPEDEEELEVVARTADDSEDDEERDAATQEDDENEEDGQPRTSGQTERDTNKKIVMAPAAVQSCSQSILTSENDLKPFFILHRASWPAKPLAKARRKINLTPTPHGFAEQYKDNLQLETFKCLSAYTESCINDAVSGLNAKVFDEIHNWVHVSFNAIHAMGKLDLKKATGPFPVLDCSSNVAEGASRQIFTGVLFTKNIDFVDDIRTFAHLGSHLKSRGCRVANLTSLDFSSKNGVGGCLKTLFRQILSVGVDAPSMSILASWYAEKVNYENPLVVIIDELEKSCSSVLDDFVSMLREWLIKIPVILILRVATTIDSLVNILSSNTYLYLSISEFTLQTPAERMDTIVEANFLNNCQSMSIGKQVSAFLRDCFLKRDGTLTLFIRALKIAMVQHIYTEPLSFILPKFVEESAKGFNTESILMRDIILKPNFNLQSLRRSYQHSTDSSDCASEVSEVKRLRKLWNSMVRCLYEVGKYCKIRLLDLYGEILGDRSQYPTVPDHLQSTKDNPISMHLKNEGYLTWALTLVRDLPAAEVRELLKRWDIHTRGITEIHKKVKELQQLTTFEKNQSNCDATPPSKKSTARNQINQKADKNSVNEKVATFLPWMVRQCIESIQCMPFREILLFNNVDKLEKALIGDPRTRIQTDLLVSSDFLKCSCCSKTSGVLVPSMHSTSIMYSLAQEHGDLINLHEWFHSFKAIVATPPSQAKKSRLPPSPKKRKDSNESKNRSDASIQAEFSRAVTELQIIGLLRMPTKRRPDYVQRVAFGL